MKKKNHCRDVKSGMGPDHPIIVGRLKHPDNHAQVRASTGKTETFSSIIAELEGNQKHYLKNGYHYLADKTEHILEGMKKAQKLVEDAINKGLNILKEQRANKKRTVTLSDIRCVEYGLEELKKELGLT